MQRRRRGQNQSLHPGHARSRRNAGILLLVVLVIGVSAIGALGFAAYRAGSIEVSVRHGGGRDLGLRIPAAMIGAAIQLIPVDRCFEGADECELETWLPLCVAATRELSRLPDCILVEVRDGDDAVHIAKRGGHLVIEVRDRHDQVRVALPVRLFTAVASRLARANRS